MSSFDKYVVQLVCRMGDSVSKGMREVILLNIKDSIDDYQRLRDPAEAQTRKKAAAVKKRRAAARKAKEEERCRRMERQANLPPFPPSSSNNAIQPAATDSKSNKKAHKGKSAAKSNTVNSSAPSSAERAGAMTAATAAAKAPARPKMPSVQLKDIDFLFVKEVEAQLRDLGRRPRAMYSLAGSTQECVASNGFGAETPLGAASAPKPAGVRETAARNKKSESATPPKRMSPPPLDHTAMKQSDRENLLICGSDETLPLPRSDTISYQETFKTFKFGRQDVDNESDSIAEKDSQDGEQRQREAEEDEFIDDCEDARRRTIQMQRPSRGAISDSSLDIDEARIASFPTTPKSQEKMKTISRVLVRHFLFSTLDDSDIAKFASIMDVEKFEAGTQILEKGHTNDTFFIVLDGEAETTMMNEDGAEVVVPLVRGSTFGDLGLMYEISNGAAVVARSSVQCASLERRTYKMITSRAMEDKRRRYVDFLSSLPVFAGVSSRQLQDVAERLKEDSYVEGQRVIAAGVPNHWLHIITEGSVCVMAPDAESGDMKEVALLHAGDFAGQIEFLYHHVAVADVVAVSAVVKTAKLSRRSFEFFPEEARERLIRAVEEEETYATYQKRMHSGTRPPLDTTPPFDAPPSHLWHTLQQHESA
ncbi:regulatory subunit of protein kinase a-like protein [Leishmania major strain Friedlin]|uniref:Regulatory subunit of protein kinase a-like protein n=1 Tax=Leishmania major TaxID=5664 RepID=Q4Q2R2_LEIMA|nr:regulatory subunit of protein kinase a-like protein [Leishmania major strain Friedlin]CAG9582160.1 regulatory_subunit_of_protein_kinase_a-like_protein [Leishmania major strain Friedlin]CAJ08003.1 regulatory subunit of protein kinase a-like protein [Leishmania major strain Friedlin]|eukprot:XP_001686386.1 regulatory subunit of protein kinase a-like protein [Leishmania major strain Friedlin]